LSPKTDPCCADFEASLENMIGRVEDEQGFLSTYVCHKCGKEMAQKDKIRRHVEVHMDLHLPCTLCGKVLKTRNAMSHHYSKAHGQSVPYTAVQ